jgi:D-tyrosyl-tRNA(Tyr) deacylase
MRAVIQRVASARVEVDGQVVGQIGRGLLVYVAVESADTVEEARWLAEKVANLRIFDDEQGKLNLSVRDAWGGVLAVSNFTLVADARKGRRPGFSIAAPAQVAAPLHEEFVAALRAQQVPVETGAFGQEMFVHSVNHGPINIVLDSAGGFWAKQ